MSKDSERLIKLAEEREHEAAAFRLAAAALNGHAVDKRAARHPKIMHAAIESDAARRAEGPTPPKKKGRGRPATGASTRAKLAAREKVAGMLGQLEADGPLTQDELHALAGGRFAFGPLMNAGYIRRVGKKYARTKKPYSVKWADNAGASLG
jgi:hypothetical protein